MNKRATYDFKDIAWIAVIIAVGIIVLSVSASVVQELRDDYTRPSATVINESDAVNLVWGNNTNMSLDYGKVTVSAVYNCTDSPTIGTGNYTVFSTEGKIQCDTNSSAANNLPVDDDLICVNYTYLADDEYWNVTDRGHKGQQKLSGWFPTIGIAIGAVIVITTLGYLGFVRKG